MEHFKNFLYGAPILIAVIAALWFAATINPWLLLIIPAVLFCTVIVGAGFIAIACVIGECIREIITEYFANRS